jgi:hypothetical protein
MPRITLDLEPSVVTALRRKSRQENTSLGELASKLLAHELLQTPGPEHQPFSWISRDLGKPTVNLEGKEALNALLDR